MKNYLMKRMNLKQSTTELFGTAISTMNSRQN